MLNYLRKILIALDQLVNTVVNGEPDETFSSRCWRERGRQPWKVLRYLVDAVFFFDKDHCRTSYLSERLQLQSPLELRWSKNNGIPQ